MQEPDRARLRSLLAGLLGELEAALRHANAPKHAVAAYQEHAAGRKALLFTPTVRLAHEMAEEFQHAGIAAEALDGATAIEERRRILKRLHSGKTRITCNCAVLTEGFDEPSVDCIIVARPTKSRPLYVQMIGRGTRRWPGKTDCLILDLVGNAGRHEIQTVATLFNVSPKALEAEPLTDVVARQRDAEARAAAQEDARGRLVATTVDLFRRAPLSWVELSPSRYVLSTGDGLLIMSSRDLQQWRVEHVDQDRQRHVVAMDLDLGFAQGRAEDYARSLGADILMNREASWRRAPASPGQLDALRRCRVPIRPGLTKGEASDLITLAVARSWS